MEIDCVLGDGGFVGRLCAQSDGGYKIVYIAIGISGTTR